LGTFLTVPTNMETLKKFYKTVHPWGWWSPVCEELKKEDPTFTKNKEFWKDMGNSAIGIVWQSSMIVLPIYFIIRDYPKAIISLVVFLITSIILKYTWLDNVRKIPN
ncbi:sodium:solute symporter, partial [bacterium AH-315-A23]|nr:sodium:solute symporter [bacterium AH-315-A23]